VDHWEHQEERVQELVSRKDPEHISEKTVKHNEVKREEGEHEIIEVELVSERRVDPDQMETESSK